MKKIVAYIQNHKRLSAAIMAAMMITSMLAVGVSADEAGGGVSSDLSTFITSIKGALSDFTTANLATILVAALGLTVGLAICWFAYRFVKRKVSGALKKGTL